MIKITLRKKGKDFDVLVKKIVGKQKIESTKNAFYQGKDGSTDEIDRALVKIANEYHQVFTDDSVDYDVRLSILNEAVEVVTCEEPGLDSLLAKLHLKEPV